VLDVDRWEQIRQVRKPHFVFLGFSSVDSYTLADLERVTGAKRRSLQLWADAGVIEADRSTRRAGTGTHRRFSRNEAIIACIIHGFALHQMAIGELFYVSMCLRVWLEPGQERVPKRLAGIVNAATRGEGNTLLAVESWLDDSSFQPLSLPPSSKSVDQIRIGIPSDPRGRKYMVSVFIKAKDLELRHLNEPEGFAAVIKLRTYLSKLDS
jgi:hypothetical protein